MGDKGEIVGSRVEAESGTMNVRVDGGNSEGRDGQGDGEKGVSDNGDGENESGSGEGEMEDDAGDHLPRMVILVSIL